MGSFCSKTQDHYASGKNVLITGASGGIGAELARRFAAQGASLALLARSPEKLSAVAQECTDAGAPRTKIFPCDLTDNGDLRKNLSWAVETFGTFDVVVLNAGRSMGCYLEEIRDHDQIDYLLKLNTNAVIHCVHALLPAVPKTSDSRIVVISSVSGILPVPLRSVYCASKHALSGFCGALRIELKDTYGEGGAPAVQVINFPEVRGTDLNTGRMDFGAEKPPAEYSTAVGTNLLTVQKACQRLLKQIEKGTREWGQTPFHRMIGLLQVCAGGLSDRLILRYIRRTHFRPGEKPGGPNAKAAAGAVAPTKED